MCWVGWLVVWDWLEWCSGILVLDGFCVIVVVLVFVSYGGIFGMGGGFIGVDVFFVLSGFFIILLLFDELGCIGCIDLSGFWICCVWWLLLVLVLMVFIVSVVCVLFFD